jgi:NAD(P)-dependent dehydrogenase (short-subunit alcohol dehydrogenase family)
MALSVDLEGRVILVCGVARGGIGGAVAMKAVQAGATIFAVDHSQDILDPIISDIEATGGRCHGMVADLLDPVQSDPIAESVWTRFGRLDGVANVCGGIPTADWAPIEQTPLDTFRKTMNFNFEYVFRICRDAAASMIKRDWPGSFVNIGSISGLAAAPDHGPYGAAKAAIAALTRTMAHEWARYGIRANTVNPGNVLTERAKIWMSQSDHLDLSSTLDTVWTQPDELGQAVVFLLSDLASGISGQSLTVDSGLSTKFCGAMGPLHAVKRTMNA